METKHLPAQLYTTAPPLQARWGFLNAFIASCGHALTLTLRRKRLVLAAVVTLLPVLIPVAMTFLSASQFQDNGYEVFVRMVEPLHLYVLSPLLALFFATMLVAEDVDGQTLAFMLTRPFPRSAWVLGRFSAYGLVAGTILVVSIILTFAACTSLAKLEFDRPGLTLLAHYCGVALASVLVYGAAMLFIGVAVRRSIVTGVLLLYGWEKLATLVPGVVDLLTVRKYITALFPVLPTQRANQQIETVLGTFNKDEFMVSATHASITLVCITLAFLLATVLMIRYREFAGNRAAGG